MNREQRVIEREVFIAAPPEAVFKFLIDAQLMTHWLGSFQQLDPQPGGIFQVEVSPGNIARGEYTEVVPFRRVAFTWGWNSLRPILLLFDPGRPSSKSSWNRRVTERGCGTATAVCPMNCDRFTANAGPPISIVS